MKIPAWIQDAAARAARGLNLVPSETDKMHAQRAQYAQALLAAEDRSLALQAEVRKIEGRMLKLDAKLQAEHGVIARTTAVELQIAGVELKHKEKELELVLRERADINLMVHNLDRLLGGRPIKADEWDRVVLEREDRLGEEQDAGKARDDLQRIGETAGQDLGAQVNVPDVMSEIRGERPSLDAATTAMLDKLKRRSLTPPEE